MADWLRRSRKHEREQSAWPLLALALVGVAAAVFWLVRRLGGTEELLPSRAADAEDARAGRTDGEDQGRQRSEDVVLHERTAPGGSAGPRGTPPAGEQPMAGARPGETEAGTPEAEGLTTDTATVTVAEPEPSGTPEPPAASAPEIGEAPLPAEWHEALASESETEDQGTSSAQAAPTGQAAGATESAPAASEADVTPSIASGWVEVKDSHDCPEGYPIKGNATSRIYHLPGQPNYDRTIPEICFADEEAAQSAGYRAPRR